MTKFTTPIDTNRTVRILPKPGKAAKTVERIGFSTSEAAESLGVSVPMIAALIKEGKIRTVLIGRRVVISIKSLRDFVDGTEKQKSNSENADDEGIAWVAERKEIQ